MRKNTSITYLALWREVFLGVIDGQTFEEMTDHFDKSGYLPVKGLTDPGVRRNSKEAKFVEDKEIQLKTTNLTFIVQ